MPVSTGPVANPLPDNPFNKFKDMGGLETKIETNEPEIEFLIFPMNPYFPGIAKSVIGNFKEDYYKSRNVYVITLSEQAATGHFDLLCYDSFKHYTGEGGGQTFQAANSNNSLKVVDMKAFAMYLVGRYNKNIKGDGAGAGRRQQPPTNQPPQNPQSPPPTQPKAGLKDSKEEALDLVRLLREAGKNEEVTIAQGTSAEGFNKSSVNLESRIINGKIRFYCSPKVAADVVSPTKGHAFKLEGNKVNYSAGVPDCETGMAGYLGSIFDNNGVKYDVIIDDDLGKIEDAFSETGTLFLQKYKEFLGQNVKLGSVFSRVAKDVSTGISMKGNDAKRDRQSAQNFADNRLREDGDLVPYKGGSPAPVGSGEVAPVGPGGDLDNPKKGGELAVKDETLPAKTDEKEETDGGEASSDWTWANLNQRLGAKQYLGRLCSSIEQMMKEGKSGGNTSFADTAIKGVVSYTGSAFSKALGEGADLMTQGMGLAPVVQVIKKVVQDEMARWTDKEFEGLELLTKEAWFQDLAKQGIFGDINKHVEEIK